MAYIILPSRWTRQPRGPVGVDWSNSLARDLAILVTGSSLQDAASGFAAKNVGLPVTGSAQGLVFDGDNSGFTAWTTRGNPHLAQKKTILQLSFSGGAAYSENEIACLGGGSTGYWWFLGPISSTRLQTNVDHRGTGSTDSSYIDLFNGTDDAAKWHVVAFTCDSGVTNGSQFWLNGVANGAAHTSTARSTDEWANSTGEPYIGIGAGLYYNGGYLDVGNKVALFAHWNRILSEAEIREVSRNPWQLFRPIQRRIYVPSAGTGGVVTATSSLDLAVRESKSATASLGAAVQVGVTATSSLSVAVRAAISATASLSAAVRAEQTATASLNAAVLAATSATASLNAALALPRTASADLSAAVYEAKSLTASLSVALLQAKTAGASLDTYVLAGAIAVVSLDVAILQAKTAVADLSAAIALRMTASADLSAAIALRNTATVTLGAAVRAADAASASLSAYIYDAEAIVYGALNRRSQRADRAARRKETTRTPQVDKRRRLH